MEKRPTGNPRYANGALRRKYRARLRAMGGECGICHGRLGPIHYDEPSDAAHPLSFVIDEPRIGATCSLHITSATRKRATKQAFSGQILGKKSQKRPKSAMETGSGGGSPAPRGGDLALSSADLHTGSF